MKILLELSNDAVLLELGGRIAQCRINLNLTQALLAERAGVGKRTLERVERGESAQLSTLIRLLRVLGLFDSLEGLVPQIPASPIAQLKRQGKPRRRASVREKQHRQSTPWKWAE